jgi:hypothetical protein
VVLPAGGGAWAALSDREGKTHFAPIDERAILERLATVPVQAWSYVAQDPSIRHIGPVAQDFAAAFEVGEDDRHINTVDADGMALAAIQGLYARVQEQETRLAQQEERLTHLAQQNAVLVGQVAMLARYGDSDERP